MSFSKPHPLVKHNYCHQCGVVGKTLVRCKEHWKWLPRWVFTDSEQQACHSCWWFNLYT